MQLEKFSLYVLRNDVDDNFMCFRFPSPCLPLCSMFPGWSPFLFPSKKRGLFLLSFSPPPHRLAAAAAAKLARKECF